MTLVPQPRQLRGFLRGETRVLASANLLCGNLDQLIRPSEGLPALALSTDSNGDILDYSMGAFPAEVLGMNGLPEGGIAGPPYVDPQAGPISSALVIDYGLSTEWDALTPNPGQWTQVGAVPEPSTLLLTSLSAAILIIAMRRKHQRRTSRAPL